MPAPACRVTLADQVRFVRFVRDDLVRRGTPGNLRVNIARVLRRKHGWSTSASVGQVQKFQSIIKLLENPTTTASTEDVLAKARHLHHACVMLGISKERTSAADARELKKLRAFKAAVEPVLHHIYDVLYFDSDKNRFDPAKEIDSACDFLDMVHTEMLTLYPSPKPRSRKYPDLKVKKS